jgi:hypothetical protein
MQPPQEEITPKNKAASANLAMKTMKTKVTRKGLVLSKTKIKYLSSKWWKERNGKNSKENALNLEQSSRTHLCALASIQKELVMSNANLLHSTSLQKIFPPMWKKQYCNYLARIRQLK